MQERIVGLLCKFENLIRGRHLHYDDRGFGFAAIVMAATQHHRGVEFERFVVSRDRFLVLTGSASAWRQTPRKCKRAWRVLQRQLVRAGGCLAREISIVQNIRMKVISIVRRLSDDRVEVRIIPLKRLPVAGMRETGKR